MATAKEEALAAQKTKSENPEGSKKTRTVRGKDYILQHPGVRWYIKHTDDSRDARGNLSNEKYIDGLLEMVVIKPQVTMDSFTDVGELKELVETIESFLGAK